MAVAAATLNQIGEIEDGIDRRAPLLICDVDEVVVHFLRALEDYLKGNALWLDPASFALNGNIKRLETQDPIEPHEVSEHLMAFFAERTRMMELIDGAAEALEELSAADAEIVMLTNLPERFRPDRIANLKGHGLHFPVLTNQGPKGPAVSALALAHEGPVAFIDDNPGYLSSVADHCADVTLVHFMQDERFARHVGDLDFVAARTADWEEAARHLRRGLGLS